jgi:hypothetical protein
MHTQVEMGSIVNDQDLLDFLSFSKDSYTFLHTTNTMEKALSICDSGLHFLSLDKTTDYVCDRITLNHLMNIRKHYGDFVMLIQVGKEQMNSGLTNERALNSEGEEVFILPARFIKGFFLKKTKELFVNPRFDLC